MEKGRRSSQPALFIIGGDYLRPFGAPAVLLPVAFAKGETVTSTFFLSCFGFFASLLLFF